MPNVENSLVRSSELLSRDSSRLLIIDVQDKLLPAIPVRESLLANCAKLIDGASLFGIPLTVTEQYAKGLGPTTSELRQRMPEITIPDKRRFSASEVLNWGNAAESDSSRFQIVVAGIETHVCVQQTVLDLLAAGYQVFVAADAVASRAKFDWKMALRRMSASGAIITSTESILFEWCETAAATEFKQLSKLVTGRA